MPSISWKDMFCTGIPLLDTQNKHFVERLNLLIQSQYNAQNKDIYCQMFREFLPYVQDHFRQEDLFYEQYDPQELEEHQQQHFLFQENLNSFIPDGGRGECVSVNILIVVFIKVIN